MSARNTKKLKISKSLLSEISRYCEIEKPYEACGLLTGSNNHVKKVFPAKNTERSPVTYCINPLFFLGLSRQMRTEGMDIIGVYHSHPTGLTGMSTRDIAMGWENFFYLVVSFEREEVRFQCFLIEDGKAVNVKIQRV